MAEGVDGGVIGGTPGGVVGGCIGCTGDGPVLNYDTAPKVIKQVKPQYPQDAFVKKIEGVVLVEILIGSDGRVRNARVLQSIPVLDKAALDAAYQWVFSPALKGGRPVATTAHLPISFKIY
jgi:protein TonB